jgi:hypothetical protein
VNLVALVAVETILELVVLVQQTKATLVAQAVAITLHTRLVAEVAGRALLALTLQHQALPKMLVMVVRVLHHQLQAQVSLMLAVVAAQ